MNHRPHTSLELTPTRTTTLTTPTTTTTRKKITTPSSSFHEEYDEFGDVIKVGNITLTDTVLGTGAYATVRLAKRRTLHHHPNGGGSFNLNLHIHNTKSSDSNTLPVLSSLSSSIHSDTHNDDNEEKVEVEVEEELVAVKVYSKSFLKRQRNFQRCRSTSNTSPRRIKYHTALDQVEKEIALMKMMRHPNLVSLLQVIDSVERDALYVVLEYVPRGEIMTFDAAALRFRHLHSSNSSSSVVVGVTAQKYFEEAFAALYFVDVLHGLAYLHRHHICHRDLKPENILLDELGVAKITDFGVSHYFDEEEQLSVEHNHHDRNKNGTMMDSSWGQQQEAAVGEDTSPNAVIDTTQHAKRRRLTRYDTDSALAMHRMSDSGTLTETKGTFCFYAPEMCCSSSSDKSESGESEQLSFSGYASDLWSAGICLYIFASGKLPFYSDDPSELFSKIANTDVPLHGEDCHHFSDELKNLLSMILQRDPEKRAGIGDCLKHPFCEKARKERVKFLGEEINESLLKKIIVQREHIKNAFGVAKLASAAKAAKQLFRRSSFSSMSSSSSPSMTPTRTTTPKRTLNPPITIIPPFIASTGSSAYNSPRAFKASSNISCASKSTASVTFTDAVIPETGDDFVDEPLDEEVVEHDNECHKTCWKRVVTRLGSVFTWH